MKVTMDKLVALCKSRGLIFAGSDIYGGFANTWDYGPVGVELYNNIKKAWWQKFVTESENNFGLDCSILMNPKVWEASGHLAGFSDPLMDCKACKSRCRADDLVEAYAHKHKLDVPVAAMDNDALSAFVAEHKIPCPVCGKSDFTPVKKFQLMFKTFQGVTEDSLSTCYLRPETAQGIFVNFKNVVRSCRARVPFGVCQIGKSFRNEITPGNFIFRTIEFEQMEHQWFCKDGTDAEFYAQFKEKAFTFLVDLGFKKEHLRFHDHDKLAHYAKAACDIQYLYPMGWQELNGIHNRTDYDLSRHQEYSGKTMTYIDPVNGERFIPYVIEYSIGADRLMLAVLSEAYDEEPLEGGDVRNVLRFHPAIAAYKAAVLPLQKNLSPQAKELLATLKKYFSVTYDEAGSIGKRYRRQDEIGTPFCITADFDTVENGTFTVRDRDTMSQIRLDANGIIAFLTEKTAF